jgi:hypothetical protein
MDDEMPDRDANRRNRADAGFDRWLSGKLHEMYDPVLNEEVPDDLDKLLEGFASRSPQKPQGSGGSGQ